MKLDHLAIIMDGNRRWANANNLPSYEGHKKGAENLWNLIENVRNYKLKYLTVFVFSTENWKRSNSETSYLVSLLGIYLDDIISKKNEINIKIRFIGDMSIFNKKIHKAKDYSHYNHTIGIDENTRYYRDTIKLKEVDIDDYVITLLPCDYLLFNEKNLEPKLKPDSCIIC